MVAVRTPRGLDELRREFEKITKPEWRRFINEQLAQAALAEVSLGFERQADPYGEPWKPLRSRNGQILRDTGRLLNSITPFGVTETSFRLGTNAKSAPVHQYGAVIRPKNARALSFWVTGAYQVFGARGRLKSPRAAFMTHVFAQKVSIPQRQYIPEGSIPEGWMRVFETEVDAALNEVFSR